LFLELIARHGDLVLGALVLGRFGVELVLEFLGQRPDFGAVSGKLFFESQVFLALMSQLLFIVLACRFRFFDNPRQFSFEARALGAIRLMLALPFPGQGLWFGLARVHFRLGFPARFGFRIETHLLLVTSASKGHTRPVATIT